MSLETVREVVLDVETSGGGQSMENRIIEIGVVEVINYKPTKEYFHHVVNPGKIRLSSKITKLTGLRKQDLEGKPKFSQIAVDLLAFIGDSKIIAHNAQFDRYFVNSELYQAYRPMIPEEQWICSLELARSTLNLQRYSLDHLCNRFGISLATRDKHGALIDARLTSQVYSRLRAMSVQNDLGL